MGEHNFDLKTWAIKGAKKVGTAVVAVACIETADYFLLTQDEIPLEWQGVTAIAIIILSQIGNWLKHK